ncbi:MAG: toll/interleukin-1 receptor domain-containing protein [Acidobacteriota bacterium]|nr:MAG: toll/interleukin-1 receptor domain-containing protein [Acidobacteriota bacterium]
MAYKIFISATQNDIELARDVARRLEAAGVRVYPVDKTAVPGEKISTAVNQSLREADEVIMILTRDSGDSPGLISEMGKAFSLRKPVTPILVNIETDKIPAVLNQIEPVKYGELPNYISKLVERMSLEKAS